MGTVRQTQPECYEVTNFSKTMPHLQYVVTYQNGTPSVTAREGNTSTDWDHHAVRAVISAIDNDTVIK